jgi:hypothetical protein
MSMSSRCGGQVRGSAATTDKRLTPWPGQGAQSCLKLVQAWRPDLAARPAAKT